MKNQVDIISINIKVCVIKDKRVKRIMKERKIKEVNKNILSV